MSAGAVLFVVAVSGLKSFVLLGVACMAVRVARSPAARHAIWSWAAIGALALPLLSRAVPELRLPLPSWSADPGAAAPLPLDPRLVAAAGEEGLRVEPFLGGLAPAADAAAMPRILLLVWMAVAALLLLRTGLAHVRAWAAVRAGTPAGPSTLRTEFERMHPKPRGVALVESPRVTTPASYGIFRRTVLVPAGSAGLDAAQARAILAHELAHLRRRDCLTQLLAELSRAVYWFNPLLWMAVRRMAEERESACDELVLHAGTARTVYAALLLDVARQAPANPAAALTAVAGGSCLERRIRRILRAPLRGRAPWPARLAARSMAAVAAVTLLAAVAAAQMGNREAGEPLPEPDLARDFLARPQSEHLGPAPAWRAGDAARLLAGPDSALARMLIASTHRRATDHTDLVAERARWALAQARGGRLAEPLIERMASQDWRVRAYAAWALAYSGDARAVPRLMAAAGESNWRLRAMAVAALEKLNDPRAYPVMRRALRDPAWQVRVNAVEYLGRIPGARGRGLTRAHLNDRHVVVRMAAARAGAGDGRKHGR